jgi:hypothetical protein
MRGFFAFESCSLTVGPVEAMTSWGANEKFTVTKGLSWGAQANQLGRRKTLKSISKPTILGYILPAPYSGLSASAERLASATLSPLPP